MELATKHGIILEKTERSFEELGVLNPAVFQDGNVSHRDADFVGKLGDAHLPLRQHDVDVNDDCHAGLVTPLSRSRILYPRHFVGSAQILRRLWR